MVHESCSEYDTKVEGWCKFSDLHLLNRYKSLQIKNLKSKHFFFQLSENVYSYANTSLRPNLDLLLHFFYLFIYFLELHNRCKNISAELLNRPID